MNIDKIAQETDRYTLHAHTQFCDGHATMEQFARAAAEAGFKHFGFTPHSPVPIVSPCNMSMHDVPTFLGEVARLNARYGGEVTFYAGMEIDYLGGYWGPHSSYFRDLPLDYRIGSVHFIPSQEHEMVDIDGRYETFRRKMHEYFHDDIGYVVNTFFDQSEGMIERGGFDIIGHIDKIAHNAAHYSPGIDSEPWMEARVRRLIEMAVERGLTIEINTKAAAEHHRMFPDKKWWPLLQELGASVVVNSDAHYPHLIDASRGEALGVFGKKK